MPIDLNDDTVLVYAMKWYDTSSCLISEFEDDYKRFRYIKRLIRRYKATNEIKENLILNHIVCIYNVFGNDVATRLLFFKMDEQDYDVLKTFLVFLNRAPRVVTGIRGRDIYLDGIQIDAHLEEKLRKI